MNITLDPEEATLIMQVLAGKLSDLRMEIVDTEDYDLRQDLKREEEVIKQLLDRLGRMEPTAA